MDIQLDVPTLLVSYYQPSHRYYTKRYGYTSAAEIVRQFQAGASVTVLEKGRDITVVTLLRALAAQVDIGRMHITPEQLRELVRL